MLSQLFTNHNIKLFPLVVVFMLNAITYFVRLLDCLIFRSRRKRTYHGLWVPPYLLFLACLRHPGGYYSRFLLVLMPALWLFSSVCAILQIKVSMGKSWKLIWEDAMKRIVCWIDNLRCLLFNISAKFSRIPGLPIVSFVVGVVVIQLTIPQFMAGFLILSAFAAFLTGLGKCVSSCWALLVFWFVHSVFGAYVIYSALNCALPSDIVDANSPLAYGFICALLIVFWSLSAGVADYDVAKMAGAIMNTITTILLIAANIFLGWLQWNVAPDLPVDYGGVLYMVNLAVFPVVAAGYLAMLFADGLEYCRKRVKSQGAERIRIKKTGCFQNLKAFFGNTILRLITGSKRNYLKNDRSCDTMKTEKREWVAAMSATAQLEEKRQRDMERIRGFRLLDDDFMNLCFEGEPACAELVLRIVLGKDDLTVTDVRTQVFVENLTDRSVRLDVVAVDSAGVRYNIEIQRADRGAGRKRARYNASMMDVSALEKSAKFEALPEVYVVFITERDVLKGGRPVYRIERRIGESGELFGDGSHIVYVNGAYRDESAVGKLMHDFACADPDEMHYGILAERVRFFKETKEGSATMCKIMEDIHNEGMKEGIKEGIKETALRMLRDGSLALEKIAELAGLPLEEVEQLKTQAGI